MSYCRGLDNNLVYHPGSCEGWWERHPQTVLEVMKMNWCMEQNAVVQGSGKGEIRISFLFTSCALSKGFPVVRGRVDLHRISKWTDSTCQTIDFPPYRFYPDKNVHVQITVNHIKLNETVLVHDAVTSWTESVNTKNFTVCVMQTGRNSGESFNPFATLDWLAYQGAPPNGMTGTIKMQNWWSGTKCANVAYPKVKETSKLMSLY